VRSERPECAIGLGWEVECEEFDGIQVAALPAYAEVEVGSGGAAAGSAEADQLAATDVSSR
jgi:hypothetical protein